MDKVDYSSIHYNLWVGVGVCLYDLFVAVRVDPVDPSLRFVWCLFDLFVAVRGGPKESTKESV